MPDQAQYNFPYSIGDLRPSLLLEISRLLNEVSDYSNVKVSNSYKILDRDYIKKVRTLISKTRIYISAVYSVTDNPTKRKTLEKAKSELLRWELYFRKGRINYFVLEHVLGRITEIINSATGIYGLRTNPYEEEQENQNRRNPYDIL
jgi:hypothetical protein